MQHNEEKLGDVDKIRKNGNCILIEWDKVSSVEFSALHIL